MFRLPLSACVGPLEAQLKGDDFDIASVSIDTRTLQPGDVYVAIRGDQFDGHQFIDQAISRYRQQWKNLSQGNDCRHLAATRANTCYRRKFKQRYWGAADLIVTAC